MYRMHAECLYDRQKQRCKDQDCRSHVHKCPCDQQDHVHDQQDQEIIICQPQQRSGNRLRDLQECHHPAQDVGHTDEKDHHTAHFGTAHYDIPKRFQRDISVKNSKHKRINYCDRRTFCRRKYSYYDPSYYDHDQR